MPSSRLKTVLTDDADRVESLVEQGYCPIECSIGGDSIVDTLKMDHHGELSHLEPVSIRAYRDHWGARRDDPRFIGVGEADADMCFAAASLAGLVPHPSREVDDDLPESVRDRKTRDLQSLAETVALIDAEPIGLDIPSLPFGSVFLTWQAMSPGQSDALGFETGIGLWRRLTEGNPEHLETFFEAAEAAEQKRRERALQELDERGEQVGDVLVVRGSTLFGFPEWYGRQRDTGDVDSPDGWTHPVVMAWSRDERKVTVGCPNDPVAEDLFGAGGLKNLFDELQPPGWGGRESIGGSPRGRSLDWDQVRTAAERIDDAMQLEDGA
jgi:hypothetical protein